MASGTPSLVGSGLENGFRLSRRYEFLSPWGIDSDSTRTTPLAMSAGGTYQEIVQLNIETLWSGGPFAEPVI